MAPSFDDFSSPEPATRRPPPNPPPPDDLDDLFNYDIDDDPFAEPVPAKSANNAVKKPSGAGLGIDEEVEVAKKVRVPRVKLDENRLLSQAGIPKLRQRAKDLKLKGKGHEYSDAARLLQMYQLWLDDLFPKARFLDALAMVEKVGHKKRIQMVRDQLINETGPKSVHEESMYDEPQLSPRDDSDRRPVPTKVAPIFEKRAEERQKTPAPVEDMEEDLYNATPRAPRVEVASQAPTAVESSIFGVTKITIEENPEDDLDDLDALLAEQEMDLDNPAATNQKEAEPDFDDEMEAMAEMDDMW